MYRIYSISLTLCGGDKVLWSVSLFLPAGREDKKKESEQ